MEECLQSGGQETLEPVPGPVLHKYRQQGFPYIVIRKQTNICRRVEFDLCSYYRGKHWGDKDQLLDGILEPYDRLTVTTEVKLCAPHDDGPEVYDIWMEQVVEMNQRHERQADLLAKLFSKTIAEEHGLNVKEGSDPDSE